MSAFFTDEKEVRSLYQLLIEAWNQRKAGDFAEMIEIDGNLVGFDGNQINGRSEVGRTLKQIFAEHQTATYVYIIKEVRFLTPITALLRAIAGMLPPGQTDLDPAFNTVQSLVAVKHSAGWRIALFQNTPAQFHGRPDLAQAMTDELRQQL